MRQTKLETGDGYRERGEIVRHGREEIKRKTERRNEQREIRNREERKTLIGKGTHKTAEEEI